jgi:hypothetical protein
MSGFINMSADNYRRAVRFDDTYTLEQLAIIDPGVFRIHPDKIVPDLGKSISQCHISE